MKVVEDFYSLQGEGKYAGVPSYFVRTTGCNLRCAWKNSDGSVTKCDTPYTSWNPEAGKNVTAEDIIKKLQLLKCTHVVITGGEPTLQRDLPDVVRQLQNAGYLVTIETNGTKFASMKHAFLSISPKLMSSYAQEENSREAQLHKANNQFVKVVKEYVKENDYQLKFVYNNSDDEEEIMSVQEEIGVPSDHIYLMPQGIAPEQFREKQQEMFYVCMKHAWNYTGRLHIDVWGNVRGK